MLTSRACFTSPSGRGRSALALRVRGLPRLPPLVRAPLPSPAALRRPPGQAHGQASLPTGEVKSRGDAGRDETCRRPPVTLDPAHPFLAPFARRALDLLSPMDVPGVPFVRRGRDGDGGYVQLDDLGTVHAAYSIGIGSDVSWDVAMADLGVEIWQYDHTIARPPQSHPKFHFQSIGLAATPSGDGTFRTLDFVGCRERSCPAERSDPQDRHRRRRMGRARGHADKTAGAVFADRGRVPQAVPIERGGVGVAHSGSVDAPAPNPSISPCPRQQLGRHGVDRRHNVAERDRGDLCATVRSCVCAVPPQLSNRVGFSQ